MRSRSYSRAGALAAILCIWLAACPAARAEDVQVNATVSDSSADVGQSVDYTITVTGAADANVPENVNVNGLTITYVGPNSQTEIEFGSGFGSGSHFKRSVIHTYSVVPQRPGDFTIPAQQVVVDGKTYSTQPVNLKVGGTASARSGQLYYAEFVLPRDTAYIGEALPFEVRLYVDARVRAQLEELPEITAEGCTVEKVTKPTQTQVMRNGQEYVMVTYKTAITPAQAGKVTLGPVTVEAEAQLPQTRARRRTGGPFDDPIFQNPFFDDAFRSFSPPQQITIRGEPVQLTVKPLPAEGQPPSFSGAVGTYSMDTSVKPTAVKAGDPVTITVQISGRGNFDRVLAPQIEDPAGWRVYPPSAKFEADDEVGISGKKTFDIAAIPETKKTETPALKWSYFDPIKEGYVTLTGKSWPINVQGELPAAPVVAQQAAQAAPTPAAPDIAYIRAESTGWGETFEPVYENRLFWAAQGAPLLALLAFVGLEAARRRSADEQARLHARYRKEKDAALAELRRRDMPEGELYQAAARALRLEAAIQTGRSPETLDGREVAGARALDETMAERVRRLFDRQAEVLYAGTSGGRSAASSKERTEVLETVKGYENARPAK